MESPRAAPVPGLVALLALIDRLDLVEQQFSAVHVPEQVWDELVAGGDGTDVLRRYRERDVLEVVPVDETDLFRELRRELDLILDKRR